MSVLPALSGSAVPEDLVPVLGLSILAAVCFLISAVLSVAQEALRRVTRSAVEDYQSNNPTTNPVTERRLARVFFLAEERTQVLVAVGFVRTMLDMAAAASLTLVLVAMLDDWWLVLGLSIVVAALGLGVLNLVAPNALGRRRPVRTLRALAPGVTALYRVLRPLLILPEKLRPGTGLNQVETRAEMADDLRELVDSVVDSDQLEEEDREMVRSVFELGTTRTSEVMVPRTDMITIDAQASLDDALALHVRSGFSRIPVLGGQVEDVLGVVYVKDVVRRTHRHADIDNLVVTDVMRPAMYVPEYKPVDDLLRDMQAEYVHIAMAVDEYGGIAGLVTIEDLLEEIVGEMRDEHDRAEPDLEVVTPATDGEHNGLTLRMPARTPVDEAGEAFGLDIEDDDVETIAGLLAKTLGRVPIVGAQGDALGLHLVAERVEGRRKQLSTLLVSLAGHPTGGDNTSGEHADRQHNGSVRAERDLAAGERTNPQFPSLISASGGDTDPGRAGPTVPAR